MFFNRSQFVAGYIPEIHSRLAVSREAGSGLYKGLQVYESAIFE
jgi:hypothetical protein